MYFFSVVAYVKFLNDNVFVENFCFDDDDESEFGIE